MPRIVKISDLTDKEKEEWQKRLEANNSNVNLPTAKNVEEINNKANIKTSLPVKVVSSNELRGARKANPANNDTNTLGQDTKNALSNLGLGLQNGLISFAQQVPRTTEYNLRQRNKMLDETNKKIGLPTIEDTINKITGDNKDKSLIELATGYNINNQLEKQKNINSWNIQENIDTTNNKVMKKLAEVNPSIGQMAPGMIDPTGLYFIGSASGNYYDEAINQRGMDEDSAMKYSGIMGLMEGVTEIVGGSLAKGVGKNVAKEAIGKAAKLFGIDIAENFLEEAIMEPTGELTATLTGGKETADWSNIWSRMWNAGFDGGVVATVMAGGAAGLGKSINIINKLNNGQTVTQGDILMAENEVKANMNNANVREKINQAQTIVNQRQMENGTAQTQQLPSIDKVIKESEETSNIEPDTESTRLKSLLLEELNNSVLSPDDKMQILQLMDSTDIDETSYNYVKELINQTNSLIEQQTISQENKKAQNDNIMPMNTKQKYMKYKNDTNNYDATVVNEVLDITPTNRNGKRTVKQWLQVANEIGTRLADKSDAEIERIAYKSWFDTQPTKSITRYDNQAKTNLPFIKLTADEWVDTISKAANEARAKVQNENLRQTKPNIINEKVNDYIGKLNNFESNINIDTKVVTENDTFPINYKEASLGTLKNKAKNLFSKIGKRVFKNNSENIYVTNKDIYESVAQTLKNPEQKVYLNENIAVFSNLDNIIENATEIRATNEKVVDNKNRQQYDNYKYYVTNAYIDGKPFVVEFDTRLQQGETGTQERHFRLERIYPINKKGASTPIADNSTGSVLVEAPINNSIPSSNKNVNIQDVGLPTKSINTQVADYIKKNNLKMTADEFIEWASNKQLEQENNMTQQQKELYDLIDKIHRENNIIHETEEIYSRNDSKQDSKERSLSSENNLDSLNMPKVKEGYTRLYRGLESEYNPQYDKSKLDNVNGYESWTDNYDLAKAYGDNVYYIDIPTSEIKNSIIDEDSTSETYGDRHLIYKNDKPVGINGKSGNEYMIYTYHDNYKNIKYNKIENVAQDNQGRRLSEEQQKYFKDSKVRDEDGKLLAVYHGTEANAGIPKEHWFTIFDVDKQGNNGSWFGNGFYFTSNLEHAQDYAHSKGNVYEVYLNIIKPYIPYQNGNSMISFQEDFKNNFEEANKIKGKLTGKQIQDILKNNGYDGIIIGEDVIAFDSNQIKNVDNINPTSDENIMREDSENFEINKTTDNTGKELTKEQQTYFKDSRIRDDKGHLLEVYHGTNSDDFTIFDKSYIGTANDKGWYGDGFYFATHKGEAKYYGNNVISAYLDIKNPFEFGKLRYLNGERIDTVNAETYATLKNLINEFPELAKEEMFLGYDNNQHKGIFITYKQYVDEITKLAEKVERIEVYDSDEDFTYWYRIDGRDVLRNQQEDSYENKLITAISWWREHNDHLIYPTMHMPETYIQDIEGGFQKILINHGYDGVIQENTAYDSDEIVAFYPEQIKRVDNLKPTSNPDILKEEYQQLTIDGFNNEPENNLSKENWNKYKEAKNKTTETLKRDGTKVEISKRKFSKDFVDNGYIDLNGKTVKNAADVADMAQIFRNPKYETFRVIYMQGNTIVGQEAVSSKIPNNTSVFVKDDSQARGLYKIENRMQRLGADGYYLIHNHPTGVARASEADINVTKIIDKKIKGFLGHVIINSGTYSLIERSKTPGFTDTLIWNDEIKIENYKPDDIDNMLSKEAWANTQIRNKDDILNLAYDLKNNPNYSSLIMADAKQKARIILDIPNSFLNMKLGQINGYIRNVARKNGASHAYIATQNSDVFDKMSFSNALQDCILYNIDENGNMVAKQSKTTDAPGKSIFQAYGSMALRANEKIDDIYSELYNKQSTQTEITPPIDNNLKQRKHYKSIIESNYTSDEAKAISRQLLKSDEYVPESNNKQLEIADKRIQTAGADSELNSLMSRAINGGVIKSDDIAVGERLIQYYSKTGNKAKLQEAIQATAMAGTTAGQTVQAFALLNHQTPEGQAIWLQRSVEKMNNDLKKQRGNNADQFDLTPDMIDKIVNSGNTEELHSNLDEVYEELGQQVSKTTLQKIDAWRYFSMLANPRTHIRNIAGNVAMGKVQSVKNKVAGVIEGAVSKINPEMERTHTIIPASEEVKQFAKNDIKNVADRLELNDNKYNPKTRLENSMRTFKSEGLENTLGRLFDLNDKLLEVEDGWGLKAAYTKSLAEYMTANKLTPDNITDKQLAQARNYAVEQAKEATFHQASALASALNQFSNKNQLTKFTMDATLPFKKTPINIAKAGLEYSPVGLAKSAIYDTVQLRKGNITANKYIDNISKGLTGTGIAVLGYALAKAGILKASGSDDKDKENYDRDRGSQTYSIQIGDKTYSLDWLAPSAIPLFIGAETYEIKQQEKENKTSSSDDDTGYSQAIKSATNILDGFTNAMNPMTEMSMLSGLTSALRSYDGDSSKMLANLSVNAANSYVNQFIPTALGQVAKTTDKYERSTTSTKTGVLPKAIDSTKNYAMSKIPGLRQKLPIKNDIWGNEVKQSENSIERALENAVFPFTKKTISNTNVDKALTKLYDETGESSVIPDAINKKITINGQDYRFTNDEYAKYRKDYGATSYELINSLVNTKDYEKLSTEQQQKAIENIYSYAKERNKVDYANKNNIEITPSTLYNTMEELKKSGGNQSQYLNYAAQINGLKKESEKNEVLSKANYTNKTKEIIYSNGTGKDDSLYDVMKNTGIDINEYLKYKTQSFESDKQDDGTTTGKSVSGSKKAKVYDYVNKMNINYNQRLVLLGTQYKLSDTERTKLAQYVNNLKTSKANKLSIYEKLQGFTVYKDGRVTW